MVSVAQGPPIEGGQSVWICMTNNSLIDDGFTAGEPRVCADLSLRVSIRSEFDGSESIADTYDSDGLAFQQEGTATCTKGYEATSRITVPTTRTCHFDDYTSADTGLAVSPWESRRPGRSALTAPTRPITQTRQSAGLAL